MRARSGHREAAAQPLSATMTTGPVPLSARILRWVQHGFGQRQNDERCGQQTDQRQPPRRLVGGLFLVFEADKNPRRRKFDLAPGAAARRAAANR